MSEKKSKEQETKETMLIPYAEIYAGILLPMS